MHNAGPGLCPERARFRQAAAARRVRLILVALILVTLILRIREWGRVPAFIIRQKYLSGQPLQSIDNPAISPV
jgi:hypothetical protein